MKIKDILTAAEGLKKLATQDMPIKSACRLAELMDMTEPVIGFWMAERTRCGDGEELHAVEELELPAFCGFEKIEIPISASLTLSARDVKLTEPLISFREGNDAEG